MAFYDIYTHHSENYGKIENEAIFVKYKLEVQVKTYGSSL